MASGSAPQTPSTATSTMTLVACRMIVRATVASLASATTSDPPPNSTV
jgi:hypothetical protein